MYTLKEAMNLYLGTVSEQWNGQICCLDNDAEMTYRTNKTQGNIFCYSFTLVLRGSLTLISGDSRLTFRPDDLYIYSPGLTVTILSVSDDFQGICLLADEGMSLSLPMVHMLVRKAAYPIVEVGQPQVTLPSHMARQLETLMRQMLQCQQSDHLYKTEMMQTLYSAFLLDLLSARQRLDERPPISPRANDIFTEFMRLLPLYFDEHHDIPFYASKLHITPIYLSRIVRQVTGRTVLAYINQYLLMEAAWLLRTTNLSIAQIADRLHFADAASFSKFFTRLKGQSPRDFRSRI